MFRLVCVAVSLAVALAFPVTADAGKYRGGSVTPVMAYDRDGDGVISWDDDITFVVVLPSNYPGTNYDVQGSCYQNGVRIYNAYQWFQSTPPTWRLDSEAWPNGTGATCTAYGYAPDGGRDPFKFGTVTFAVAP